MKSFPKPVLERFLILIPVLLLFGCFFLPDAVSSITDAKSIDTLMIVNAQSVSFETSTNLSMTDRLSLAANATTESLTLKNGKFRDEEAAGKAVVDELQRMLNDTPFKFNFDESITKECSASFVIDSENPAVSIIIWNITLTDSDGRRCDAAIDDETGMVLQLLYKKSYSEEQKTKIMLSKTGEFITEAEAIALMMTDYYGLPVSIEDYEVSGTFAYYRADMTDGGHVLPLYGVVRQTGFSINERV